ncbi:MAG: hypothetical protein NTW49_05985 [Bacteroidia bacterium]|nr:hypothetical protein [Bacteroidia bacterium]
MERVTLKKKPCFCEEKESNNTSLLTYDLPGLIEEMKNSYAWSNGEPDAKILFKSNERQIVLTALHEGTEIKSFQSNDSLTFQIIEGKLMFHSLNESVSLDKGQLLTMKENTDYSLTTSEKTMLLLTIANGSFKPAKI